MPSAWVVACRAINIGSAAFSVIAQACFFWCLALVLFGIQSSRALTEAEIRQLRAVSPPTSAEYSISHGTQTIQDRSGFLWISDSQGIKRYDGVDAKVYKLDSGVQDGVAGTPYLALDSESNLYASDSRLHRFNYDTNDFDAFSVSEGATIQSVDFIGPKSIWIAGDGFGLRRIDADTMEVDARYTRDQYENAPTYVRSIVADKGRRNIWICANNGLLLFNTADETFTRISTPLDPQFPQLTIRQIVFDEAHEALWVATSDGLLRIDAFTLEPRLFRADPANPYSLPITHTTSVFVDSERRLWVGLEKQGIALYDRNLERFYHLKADFSDPLALPATTIEGFSEDDAGTLWIAVNSQGVRRITPKLDQITTLAREAKRLPQPYFPTSTDLLETEDGRIWIATDGDGLQIYDPETRELYSLDELAPMQILSSRSIISLEFDGQGYIWAGTWAGGIMRIDPKTYEVQTITFDAAKPYDRTIAGNNVFDVFYDGETGLWLSIWSFGLQHYDYETGDFESYFHERRTGEKGVNNSDINDIQEYNGKLLLAGSAGLEFFDPETGEVERLLYGSEYFIKSTRVDGDILWITTTQSFVRYNLLTRKVEQVYTTDDGLPGKKVFNSIDDGLGGIWLTTANGITYLNEQENTLTNLTENDGIASLQSSTFGVLQDSAGRLYFSSIDGVTIINPSKIPRNLIPPRTVITAAKFSGTNRSPIEFKETDLNVASPVIASATNNLEVNFASLNFIYPEQSLFRYRLSGWSDVMQAVDKGTRKLNFTNLVPGDYEFQIYSSNNHEIWDVVGDKFTFTILPPWWHTWWARVLFVLAAILATYLYIQSRLRANLVRERELKSMVAERTVALEKAKEDVEKNAYQLEKASTDLKRLNATLEHRVEERTNALMVEVEERKVAEAKLFHMAFHDGLTGLPNRPWLLKELENLLEKAHANHSRKFGIMFLDGDRFKQINDTHGHLVGDQLLIASALRLSGLLTDDQAVARLGGDEFTVVDYHVDSQSELHALAGRIVEAFQEPFYIDKHTIYFNVSIGVLLCDYQYIRTSSILRDADIAMYKAKEAGKGSFKVFDSEMRLITKELADIEADLRVAISEDQFRLVYQPLVSFQSDGIVGFESLIRWEHPTKGNIPPVRFIGIAEECGLITDIGNWVLRTACVQIRKWHDADYPIKPVVSINLSSNQLRNGKFTEFVDEIVESTQVPTRFVKLELTETILIDNNETIMSILEHLRSKDIELAIDDFGTGYSSLSYLNELPVQHIKIDRKFIDAIDNTTTKQINTDALEIVKATISLGQSLRMKVIAEGIETFTQYQALKEINCDFGQGYYIAKPLELADATAMLQVPPKTKEENSFENTSNTLERYRETISNRPARRRDFKP